MEIRNISVFGLGQLGGCIAATVASRGFQGVGYDVDKHKTEVPKKRLAPMEKPCLQETKKRFELEGLKADFINSNAEELGDLLPADKKFDLI